MNQPGERYIKTDSLRSVHWFAIFLVILTGGIHLYAGFIEARIPVFLAGIGFLVATGLFLINYYRHVLYITGIVYTAVQFPLWYVAKASEYTMMGYVDKTIQVGLIVILVYLFWISRSQNMDIQESPTT